MRLAASGALAAALALAFLSGCGEAPREDPYSKVAFDRWLAEDSTRRAAFGRFESFLDQRGVRDVVPVWQLFRTDANYAARCGIGAFEVPDETKWPAIVPTLKLVRDEVIPKVGRVEVYASFRSDALNACANGAKGSRHLAFAAVDLVAPGQTDKPQMFADLCALHRRLGPASGMGLGAYFDPDRPKLSRDGRFHIDHAGFRTWGFDYTRESSACVTMNG